TSGRQHFNRVVTQYLAQYNGSPNSDPACERIGVKTLKAIEILRSFTEISIDNYRASHISMYLWFDDAGKLMQTLFGEWIGCCLTKRIGAALRFPISLGCVRV
ncbi:hypothetical protein BVRB_019840, partial [Beta vulgaris subsp. vulgaris]